MTRGYPILGRALADRRRGLAAWSLGIAAYVAMIVAVFPSVEGSPELDELFERYPDVIKAFIGGGAVNITTGPGFIDSELFGFMLPLLVCVLGIITGSGLLAGEEDRGLLDLAAALPMSRRRIVAEKAVAMIVEVWLVSAVAMVTLVVGDPLVGLDLDAGRLVAATCALALLGTLFGAVTFLMSAFTRGRGRSAAIPATLAVALFVLEGLQQIVDTLHPWRVISPFHYALGGPLNRGVGVGDLAVLAVSCVVVLAAAILAIDRRDLRGV